MSRESEMLQEIKTSIAVIDERMKQSVSKEEFGNFRARVTTYGSAAMLAMGFLMWYLK